MNQERIEVFLKKDFSPVIIDKHYEAERVFYSKRYRISEISCEPTIFWASCARLHFGASPILISGESSYKYEPVFKRDCKRYVVPEISFFASVEEERTLFGDDGKPKLICLLTSGNGVSYYNTPNYTNPEYKKRFDDETIGWFGPYWRAIEDSDKELSKIWRKILTGIEDYKGYHWQGEGASLLIPNERRQLEALKMRFLSIK